MRQPAPSTTGHMSADVVHTAKSPVVLQRPSRWNLARLWNIAGFDGRRPRVGRFVVTLVRPPIVSDTSPPVACELIVPPRTRLGALWLCVVAATIAIAATLGSVVMPAWIALVILPAGALAAIVLIERALTHVAVPYNHLRLQDVVAQQRGSRVADRVLDELLSTVTRPVVLDVGCDAPGVISLYERVGFSRTDRSGAKSGTVTMTRPALTTGHSARPASIPGIRPRWLWPSHTDIGIGAIAAIALLALHQPSWSHHVIVSTATFVVTSSAGTDWRLHRIPNALVAAGALSLAWMAAGASITEHALAGAGIAAGPLLASNIATRGRSPGLGDVKLAAVAGATLGMIEPVNGPAAALMLTLLGGAVFGAIYQRHTRRRGFPLGPAIAASTLAVLIIQGLTFRGLI